MIFGNLQYENIIMKKVIILSFLFTFILTGCSLGKKSEELSPGEVKGKIEEFINYNLMQGDTKAVIKEIVEEDGLYKITVDVMGQEIVSYASKDAKKFFPQAMDVEALKEAIDDENNNVAANAPVQDVPKSDKPDVKLFVMSHCPYGTQIEKGILPVLESLKNQIDFKLMFNDYAMHDKVEIDEQLSQYCIQENENDKFLPYLECFLEEGDGEGCLTKTGINTSSLNSCISQTDSTFNISSDYEDKSTWKGSYPSFNISKAENAKYGVGGSPTLVINEETISSGRSPKELLDTICAGFNNPPEQCGTQLSNETFSAGFGFDTMGSGTDASCN
jgi:hypothetical protein